MQKNKKILLLGGPSYGKLFKYQGEVIYSYDVNAFKHIDLIVFTGGEDVHPSCYNGKADGYFSSSNIKRDRQEADIFKIAIQRGVKMFGICRGFQFLSVMCGGQMYQHIGGHAGVRHDVFFPAHNKHFEMISTHHQLVKPNWSYAKIVGWSSKQLSNIYIGPHCERAEQPAHEIESLFFPKFNAFGVQFHPEMMGINEKGRLFCIEMIDIFLNANADVFEKLFCVAPEKYYVSTAYK